MRPAARVGAALLTAAVAVRGQDPFEPMRTKARERYCWTGSLPDVVAAAQGYAKSLNSTCYWPDVDYFNKDRANWATDVHLARLQTMAEAITTPGSPVFESPEISDRMHCGLAVWLSHDWESPNWWWQWIGAGVQLQSIYLMLGANRTSAKEQQQMTDRSYYSAWWLNDWGGGANLSDMIKIQIMRGLASSNATALTQGFNRMWQDVTVGNATDGWEGIQRDGSYHFHGEQILTSAYGAVWLGDLMQFYVVASGSAFALPQQQVAVIADFLLTGVDKSTFGNQWDWSTQGRGVDRPGTRFNWGIDTSTVRSLAAESGAAPFASRLLNFADRIDGIASAPVPPINWHYWNSDFHSHRRPNWGASVRMHSNKTAAGYLVQGSECDNGENILGEHLADGVVNVHPNGQAGVVSQGYYEIFPLLDWNALNGATVEHSTPVVVCGKNGGSDWVLKWTRYVGGVSDGLYGCAAHDTATHDLTGRRSWFFFDGGFLALAANLSDPADANVRTTLLSRVLPYPALNSALGDVTVALSNSSGGAGSVMPDGNYSYPDASLVAWLNAGGVGVVPVLTSLAPLGMTSGLGFSVGNASGDWATIGPNKGSVTSRMVTAWLDHGRQLDGAGYAYFIAPNTTAADMPAAAAALGGLVCGANTPAVQGATVQDGLPGVNSQYMATSGAGGGSLSQIVFWEAGASYACIPINSAAAAMVEAEMKEAAAPLLPHVWVETPSMVIVALNASHVTVTVSNPLTPGGAVVVHLDNIASSGPQCVPGPAGGSSVVTLPMPSDPNLMGSSVTTVCALS